jgi:broad specificity phosphatase PhoE
VRSKLSPALFLCILYLIDLNSAGVTDSALTNHGVLQTQRLGQYLANSAYRFTKIFSSDLQRARITANAIAVAQSALQSNSAEPSEAVSVPTIQLPILREQDFGFYEAKPWSLRLPDIVTADDPRNDPDFKDKETIESVALRTNLFLDEHLLPLLVTERELHQEQVVAVVSHGVTLSVLWRCLLLRFGPHTVSIGPGVNLRGGFRPLEYLPGWTNTGYLELEVSPLKQEVLPSALENSVSSPNDAVNNVALATAPAVEKPSPPGTTTSTRTLAMLPGWGMIVKTVNSKEHLNSLRRTGGGVGSAKHDEKQRKLDGFFKNDASM